MALTNLATEKGLAFLQTPAVIVEGMGQVREGRTEAGLAQMRQGLTAWQATSTTAGRVGLLVLLSEAYAMAGRVEHALAHAVLHLPNGGQRGGPGNVPNHTPVGPRPERTALQLAWQGGQLVRRVRTRRLSPGSVSLERWPAADRERP